MAKRTKRVTLERRDNWLKVHFDSIADESKIYEPLWRTEDVPSFGIKTKIPHFKTKGRIVHLLSQNELWMYLHLVRNPLVLEIYEQYAISVDFTVAIANELGVKHPVFPCSDTFIPQTIDFMVDMLNPETGEIYPKAFPVKQDSDAMRLRTAEKLALQEAFCTLNHIEYQLVMSSELRTVYSENLEVLYRHRNLSLWLNGIFKKWLPNFFGCLSDGRHERVADLIEKASDITGVVYDIGVSFFYHGLWHKNIEMNWQYRLKLEMAASDLEVVSNG
ncbi:MAG: hypothetical protein ACI88H_001424 [Cocleimonas sp.]|jgi:hypothetical protein